MKIAVLGSSFDPPHIGHIFIAEQVKQLLGMDEIWLMPNSKHAFDKSLTSTDHRLAMTELIERDQIKVSILELERGGVSFTIDTLNQLHELYPNDEFYWIFGSDQLESFKKYKNWQDLIKKHNLIFFPRESILKELTNKVKQHLSLPEIPNNIIVLEDKNLILTNISSTLIRERVKNNQNIKYMVPIEIEKYISQNHLYQNS